MEWGIIVHVVFGAFMITNNNVFDYYVTEEEEMFKPFGQIAGKILHDYMHIESDRFSNPHGAIYIFSSGIIILTFLIDKSTAWFLDAEAGIVSYSIVCCFGICGVKSEGKNTNLFAEIPILEL